MLSGAESFLHTDLAGTLSYRDQHDIHQADTANAEGDGANKGQQNLQSKGNDVELR